MRARTGHRGRALVAVLVGLAGAFVAAVAAVPPASAAGSVSLFDDSGGTPLFNGAVLAPGHPQTGCVSVSAAGATPTDAVVLSATGVAGSLAQYLSVDVRVGTGGHLGDCTGWVADPAVPAWSGHLGDLAPGVVTGWYPGGSSTRTFRFTVEVDDIAAASGTSAGGQFVWQLSTTPPPPPPPSPSPSASPSPSVSPSPSPSASPSPTPTPTPTKTPTPTATTPGPTQPGPTTPPEPTTEPTTAPTADPTATNQPGPTAPTDGPAPTDDPDPLVESGSPTESPTRAGEQPGDGSGQPAGTPSASGAAGGPGSPDGPGGAGTAGGARGRQAAADVVLGVSLPALRETARRVSEVAMHLAEQPQYPVGVLALVAVFLLVQDLIDRRDPKLAVARVTGRDSRLSFPDLFPPERGP